MNILVLGSGGREHALTWSIKKSTRCENLFVAPGNAGTAHIAENVALDVNDFESIANFVKKESIGLVVVGPEEPLVRGIRDYFESHDLLGKTMLIGPGKLGARLEGSKDFAKAYMNKYQVPTAKSLTVTKDNLSAGETFLDSLDAPYVLKADGLAAGKGVLIIPALDAAKVSLREMLAGQFGEASSKVVIEEFLDGIELSVFVLTDGENYKILPEAKDYKRIGEGDTGPNTGGMGAISPVPFADEAFMQKVEQDVVIPTINGLQKDAIPFCGFIFIGLMNVNGAPYVIEYNVRMGDPETQAVLPRIETDLLDLLEAAAQNRLNDIDLSISKDCAATVIAVSAGYPNAYEKGKPIKGLDAETPAIIFHAGTKQADEVVTNGGRVLAATGMASDPEAALKLAYDTINSINWDGMTYRKDIGLDLKKY